MNQSRILKQFFVCLLLIGTVASVHAGGAGSLQRILIVKSRDIGFYNPAVQGFLQGLQKRGYDNPATTEVCTVALSGDADKDSKLVRDQVSQDNSLIFTLGTDATLAVENVGVTCPCLFTMILDPVSLKVVKDLNRPGGKFTGTTLLVDPGKQIEALQQVSSGVKRVGVLYTDGDATSVAFLASASQEASQLNIQIVAIPIIDYTSSGRSSLEELATKVDAFWLIVDPDSAGAGPLADTLQIARQHNIPVLGMSSSNVRSGALLSLSANLKDLGDVNAEMACPLLDKTKTSADMPVRGPRQMILSINLDSAKALGLTVPDSVLHLADEVIANGVSSLAAN